MTGLVLEGGAYRGAFTDGVLDALLENNIMFNYVIGVSAGAANAYSYISKQKGRNIDILLKYGGDKRYVGAFNYLSQKSLFGLDFIYDEIPNRLVPFDYKTFSEYKGTVIAVVTDAQTGKPCYFNQSYMDPTFQILRASCALPILFPPIRFDNKFCYDGGISDSIPINKSIKDGNDKNLVVLTQKAGYKKPEKDNQTIIAAKGISKKYPKIAQLMLNRHLKYNSTLKKIEVLERNNDAVVLRPTADLNVSRMEHNPAKLKKLYEFGVKTVYDNLDKIKNIAP